MDREVIESPDRLFASRYNQWLSDHGVGLRNNPEAESWVRKMTGIAARIDVGLRGGERIASASAAMPSESGGRQQLKSYVFCTPEISDK